MKKINVVHVLMMMVLPVLLLAGCGSGNSAPIGATISISPDKIDATGSGVGASSFTGTILYSPYTVTVLGSNGRPIANVDVNYSLDFTKETATVGGVPLDLQRIYLGPPTGTVEPTSRLLGAGTLRTDDGGKVNFVVGTAIDFPHTGDLTVHSGSASAKSTITVK